MISTAVAFAVVLVVFALPVAFWLALIGVGFVVVEARARYRARGR